MTPQTIVEKIIYKLFGEQSLREYRCPHNNEQAKIMGPIADITMVYTCPDCGRSRHSR